MPIIVVSGAEDTDLKRKMVSSNVDLFLGKPISLEDLKAAVHKLLQVQSAASYIDCQSSEYVHKIGKPRNDGPGVFCPA